MHSHVARAVVHIFNGLVDCLFVSLFGFDSQPVRSQEQDFSGDALGITEQATRDGGSYVVRSVLDPTNFDRGHPSALQNFSSHRGISATGHCLQRLALVPIKQNSFGVEHRDRWEYS